MDKATNEQEEKREIKSRDKMETESDLSDWECRTFGKIQLRSPPMVHQDDDSSNSDNPHLSPSKRKYPNMFNQDFNTGTSVDVNKQNMEAFHFNKENIPTNWNNSLTSRDSALGGSLISAYGSALTDSSSSFDAHSNSESETISNLSSPTHSTYGRYRKIYGSGSDSATEQTSSEGIEEVVVLHRLPGENLGMILGIEGDKTKNYISTVRVKSVTIGGAAYRASGSSSGIAVGDEVLEVNGLDLKTLSHDECITVFREMPLRVILKIKRRSTKRKKLSITSDVSGDETGNKNSFVKRFSFSESEDDGREGFVHHQFEIDKDPKESLGLSIVPSYGSTRQYFQIKRLLPSGAASRSRKLKVGDRLASCNGIDLRGLNQSKCLSVLKSEANNGDFEIGVLRPVENEVPTEFSLTVTNGTHNETNLILKSPQLNKRFSDNPFDTESEPEVVLNSFQNFDNLFASNSVKLSYQKPVRQPSQQTNYTSDASSDLNSSFERDFNANRNKRSKMASEEWGFALPPPVEFSDCPENGGDDIIPDTSIHDVLNDYSPTCSNMNTPIHQPTPPENMKMIEALVGLEDEGDVSSEFPLTQIEESPLEHTNNIQNDQFMENGNETEYIAEKDNSNEVVDNYLSLQKEDHENDFVNTNGDLLPEKQLEIDYSETKSDKKPEKKSKNYFNLVGKVHQFYYNSSDTMSQSENNDDEIIKPVIVKKELSVPDYIRAPEKTNVSVVDEETIAPAVIQRNNKLPVSATIDVNSFVEIKKEEKQSDFPEPVKSDSPPLPDINRNKLQKPRPSKWAEYEGEEIIETIIPVNTQKEEYSKIMEEKLGKGIEEEAIVPCEVKRDNSFSDNVQLVMLTNRWASSAKEKSSGDITFSGMVQQVKKSEPNVDNSVTVDNEDQNQVQDSVKEEESPTVEAEQPVNNESEINSRLENIGSEIAKRVVENSLIEINKSIGKQDIGKNVEPETKTIEDRKTEISVTAQYKDDSVEKSKVLEESKEEKQKPVNDSELMKTDSNSTNIHKTTVSVTNPPSVLGTVQAKSSTSATIKPLSTVKPLSFNSLSLNRPTRYTTTINTGSKPSLLSTIYSKTHSVSSNVRTEEGSFLVSVMKGILGIGMKVEVRPEGYVQVTEIQTNGPVCKDGNIRVGDYILSINSTELTGLPEHKVQQIVRLLPRGLAKLVVSVTPPDITKIDNYSSSSRPGDLSVNTGYSVQRRLTPALSPKSSGGLTSPRSSYGSSTSPTIKPLSPALSPSHHSPVASSPTSSKPLSSALSPSHHSTTASSPPATSTKSLSEALSPSHHSSPPSTTPKPLTISTSPTSKLSPGAASPVSPKSLSPALAPRKTGPQTTSKPLAMPRPSVSDPKENEQQKPPISPRRPVEETSITSSKREPPPVAPKPKPRSLPQQVETATHHKITPSFGGYVSSAAGQLKQSHGPSSVDKEPTITAHHTDYVSSARKATHDTTEQEPIDTVVFASIPSNKKTDYVSSARKTFEEPKLIPSGMVDFVPKEKPQVAERTKPASFQVLPTGSSEGGVKIAPVRLNSALSPRKTKGSDKSFNFNASYSHGDKALPRAGYFVGKTDVVTSPKPVESLPDEDVSVPPIPSPRSEGDNSMSPRSVGDNSVSPRSVGDISLSPRSVGGNSMSPRSEGDNSVSPRSKDSQIDVACTQDDFSISQDNTDTSRLESVISPVISQNSETIPLNFSDENNYSSQQSEININETKDSENYDKDLNTNAFGVVHEADIISDVSNIQEKIPENLSENLLHGENLYMHDEKSNEENDFSSSTNTINLECKANLDFDREESQAREVSQIIDNENNQNNNPDTISCMNSQINVESQLACSIVLEDLPGESSRTDMHENICDTDHSSMQFILDSDPISVEQERHESEDQLTSAITEEENKTIDIDVDKTYLDNNQDQINSLVIDSVPPEFSDVDVQKTSDIHHQGQSDSTDASNINSASCEPILISSLPSYCVKFPKVGSLNDGDFDIVSSQRPFSIIYGKQTVSVNTKSNSVEDIRLCDLIVSTSMLKSDLHLANQKMDSLDMSIDDKISVILLEREGSIPVGLNLKSEPKGGMTVSQIDETGLVQQSGQIKQGDNVLLINGEIVKTDNADAILQSLENSESHLVCVLISPGSTLQSRGDNPTETHTVVNNTPDSPTSDENANKKIMASSEPEVPEATDDGMLEITMVKGVTGLGFLIEGGLGSPRGDVPVKIKRMFRGGAAAKCGLLKVGDELVTVNGKNMAEMKHTEAWNFLKFLDDGDVKLVIRRLSQ